ncbi:4-alpha-glucanotransferase [Nitrospirillum sp. BR 11752]|uniref:4-alpha-glucanotransferase n=1 Tax=Nitrospirillum sp. BR 11752 TaxID=3104293 RepID=UPI002EB9B256|nr:4-alpha-glucanotransferase [Nitrospirillum sp. BR 11752]
MVGRPPTGRCGPGGGAGGLRLGFYRDLAVGAAPDGAETWGTPGAFALGASVGAPPDLFSAEGQVWNLPPPIPLVQEATAGAAFAELLAANMRHAGLLRVDHVMGLNRLFWVPNAALGRDGAYVRAPFDILLARLLLESHRAGVAVVGEDLGTVPEGFRERLADAGILSYRVLWFEREGDRFRDPVRWPANAAACVSTHDLPTLAGWWIGADIAEKRSLGLLTDIASAEAHAARQREKCVLLDQVAAAGLLPAADLPAEEGDLDDAVAAAIHAFVAAAPSALMLAQADDLAGEGEAVNLPGTDRERPNWRRRLLQDLDAILSSDRSRAILAASAQGRNSPSAAPDRR